MKRAILLGLLMHSWIVFAGNCHGRFVNPLTDVCWSCLFPYTPNNPTYS